MPPPRGSDAALDFSSILTHYVLLTTTLLAVVGWFVAFIGQIVTNVQVGRGSVGVLWFAIFLELFFIGGVVYTLASDSIAMHRLQISVFGSIAMVFSVIGANGGLFSGLPALNAMGAGWLLLSMVNLLWVLYFTSEQDSLTLHLFNTFGNGGLTPPSRRRTRTPSNMHNMASTGGYATNYASGGGISSADIPYDAKQGGPPVLRSQNSFGANSADAGYGQRSLGGGGSLNNAPLGGGDAPHSPLMTSSPVGGGPGSQSGGEISPAAPESFMYKAKALYNYTASPDDANELTFSKGDILDIVDKQGKWWQAKKIDGTIGIAPSNYLQII